VGGAVATSDHDKDFHRQTVVEQQDIYTRYDNDNSKQSINREKLVPNRKGRENVIESRYNSSRERASREKANSVVESAIYYADEKSSNHVRSTGMVNFFTKSSIYPANDSHKTTDMRLRKLLRTSGGNSALTVEEENKTTEP